MRTPDRFGVRSFRASSGGAVAVRPLPRESKRMVALYRSDREAHRTGNAGEGNPAVYFFPEGRKVLQGEGSLYDAAQRLFEKSSRPLRNGSDDSDVLFLEH
jgi:hypothetical protein